MNFRQLAASFISLFRTSLLPHAETRAFHHTDFQDARLPDDTDSLDSPAVAAKNDDIGLAGMVQPKTKTVSPPQRATAEDFRAAEDALVAGDNKGKHFVHYLGHFDDMKLQINDQDISENKIRRYPAKQFACEHFTVDHDDTVYVFWNHPSEQQKKIHTDLDEKNTARKGKSAHCDLTAMADGGDYTGRSFNIVHVSAEKPERVPATKMGADWKPETGVAPNESTPRSRKVAPGLRPGFDGPVNP